MIGRVNGHRMEQMPMDTPRMGHAPIKMRQRKHADQFAGVGDFYWEVKADGRRLLWVAIPHVGNRGWILSEWTIDHKNHCDASWTWDGDVDHPTLNPSVHAIGIWHGWVRKGELVEA